MTWLGWTHLEEIPPPFPPGDADTSETMLLWLKILAGAMGEPWEAFKQHWYRKRSWLANLAYVEGLRNGL